MISRDFSMYIKPVATSRLINAPPVAVCSGGVMNRKKPFKPEITKINPSITRTITIASFINFINFINSQRRIKPSILCGVMQILFPVPQYASSQIVAAATKQIRKVMQFGLRGLTLTRRQNKCRRSADNQSSTSLLNLSYACCEFGVRTMTGLIKLERLESLLDAALLVVLVNQCSRCSVKPEISRP